MSVFQALMLVLSISESRRSETINQLYLIEIMVLCISESGRAETGKESGG